MEEKIENTVESENSEEGLLKKVKLTKKQIDMLEIFFEVGKIYTSMIQRKLTMGYQTVEEEIAKLEKKHIIDSSDGKLNRKLLITREQFEILKEYNSK